jgi:glucose/mannose transport system substrate-binding protein
MVSGSDHGHPLGMRMHRRRFIQAALGTAGALAVGANLGFAPRSAARRAAAAGGNLEIFSWWTSAGEVEALDALYAIFKGQYPDVNIINAALAGGAGAGGNMKAVLQTRMLAGNPPDSFQVHLGHELIDSQVKAGRMEPIDFLYQSEGWNTTIPQGVLDISSSDGHQWAVPVNIHKSNIFWYNKTVLSSLGAEAPTTFDEFFNVAEKAKAKGIAMIALGESSPGETGHYFETVLQGTLGADAYKGLFNGKTAWSDKQVTDALNTLKRMLGYANTDYLSIAWGDVSQYVIDGKTVGQIDGDWREGYFKGKKFPEYGWVNTPGGKGIYSTLADSFGLPVGAVDRDNAIAWLKICGSAPGQDAFNPIKGSIPARTDAGQSDAYSTYQKEAMGLWKSDTIVPSIVHGFAVKESWVVDYVNAMNGFATNKDVAAAQQALVQAAQDAGVA